MSKQMVGGLLFGALAMGSQMAAAAVTDATTIRFSGATGAYYGKSNVTPEAGGGCAVGCWMEGGMVVGTALDTSDGGAHLHAMAGFGNVALGYHNDSAGIYVRAQDSTSFSLEQFRLMAPFSGGNPDANGSYNYSYYDDDFNLVTGTVTGTAGPNDNWEIYGYSSALNPTLDTDADSGDWIVKKSIVNGFTGNVTFDDDPLWQNIGAFWVHYTGYQQTPSDGKVFAMEIDNIRVNAAVPASVPVPTAVWMFGSGLLGLISFGRKKVGSSLKC